MHACKVSKNWRLSQPSLQFLTDKEEARDKANTNSRALASKVRYWIYVELGTTTWIHTRQTWQGG